MEDTDDDVECQPNHQQPACPIETVEHEHAAKNHDYSGDVDIPMSLELGNALSSGYVYVWQQAGNKGDAAEHYEYPTDDRD